MKAYYTLCVGSDGRCRSFHYSLAQTSFLVCMVFPSTSSQGFFVFVFLKFLVDTCPFLGPLVPLFWISGDVSSGFQSQSGFCLIGYFCIGECNIHSLRFTSGATLADLLAASTQLVTSPLHVQRWDLAQIRTYNHTDRGRTRYHCASDPAPILRFSFGSHFGSHLMYCIPLYIPSFLLSRIGFLAGWGMPSLQHVDTLTHC